MIVLGIDPGTGVTGYGVVALEGGGAASLRECGVIRTDASDPLAKRIREIFDGVAELVDRHDPDVVVVEAVFQGKNARSALVLGHTRGAILLAAALREREIAEYTPAEVKSAVVGRGRATKEQIGFMVKHFLRLHRAPEPADAADGVAVALCHCLRGARESHARARSAVGVPRAVRGAGGRS